MTESPGSRSAEARNLATVGEDLDGPLFSAMAEAPRLARAYFEFGAGLIKSCGLDPALRELAIAMTLAACGAQSMARRHLALAGSLGADAAKIERLQDFEDEPGFAEPEKAVLRFARESALGVSVSAEIYGGLQDWFDVRSQAAIALLVAYYAGLAHIAVPLGAEP
ncbi:MAG: carboxymuconolactone decarboxylase family protein [Caulobacteraceae bacterium]|nr:carboxymuconolactone decarboxylase family protein [Caulobacteraceae bacterium]